MRSHLLFALSMFGAISPVHAWDIAGFSPGMTLSEARQNFSQFQNDTRPFEAKEKYGGDERNFTIILATPLHYNKDGIADRVSLFFSSALAGNKVIGISRNITYVGVVGPKILDIVSSLKNKYGKPVSETNPSYSGQKYAEFAWNSSKSPSNLSYKCAIPELDVWNSNKQRGIDTILVDIEIVKFKRSASQDCGQHLVAKINTGIYDTDNVRTLSIDTIFYPDVQKASTIDDAALDAANAKSRSAFLQVGVPKL